MLLSAIKKGCRVGFFGLGQSSAALLQYLPLEKCRVTLRSDRDINWSAIPCGARIERIFAGESALNDIDEDIIIFSPSVRRDRPELLEARRRGVVFTSDAELFFEKAKQPIFAVTGSDGKSTTATLISLLLRSGGIDNLLIGNIGQPMLPSVNTAEAFVTELSSFMLTYAKPRAKRGCITNITPNHLDWHKDFEEYKKTKISLAECCEEFVISDDCDYIKGAFGIVSVERGFEELKKHYKAKLYITSEDGYILRNGEKVVKSTEIKRNERHNIKNAMMAIAITDGYTSDGQIANVLKNFDGLAHRCEKVLCAEGIDCFDSSIDSTPKRTAMTLESLERQVVIILGGRSKGLDFTQMLPQLKKYASHTVIVGENAKEIYEAIGHETDAVIAPDFESAVTLGARLARDVGTLLLSPASTSYDMFNNYAERGDRFKAILQKIYGK